MSNDKCSCLSNVYKINDLLDSLGFIIHPEKSEFEPKQVLEFLGFILNIIDMTVTLTKKKKTKTINLCNDPSRKNKFPLEC